MIIKIMLHYIVLFHLLVSKKLHFCSDFDFSHNSPIAAIPKFLEYGLTESLK